MVKMQMPVLNYLFAKFMFQSYSFGAANPLLRDFHVTCISRQVFYYHSDFFINKN